MLSFLPFVGKATISVPPPSNKPAAKSLEDDRKEFLAFKIKQEVSCLFRAFFFSQFILVFGFIIIIVILIIYYFKIFYDWYFNFKFYVTARLGWINCFQYHYGDIRLLYDPWFWFCDSAQNFAHTSAMRINGLLRPVHIWNRCLYISL